MASKSTWWVAPKESEYAYDCILIDMDKSNAIIELKNTLFLNQSVLLSPFFSNIAGLAPTIVEMKNHSNSISGMVSENLSTNRYRIKFSKILDTKDYNNPAEGTSNEVRVNHYTATVAPLGELTLERFLHLLDKVKEKLSNTLFIVFNFSKVNHIAKTSMPVFRDFIIRSIQSKHKIIVIGPVSYCPKFSSNVPDDDDFKHILQPEELPATIEDMHYKTLVVEDDEIAAMQIERFLQNRGFEVMLAQSAEEAIIKTKEIEPNLIFMDIQLPGMSGIDAVHQLRQYYKHDSIPIIMLTADSSRDSVLSLMDANISGYVLKPFDVEKLNQEILTALIA